MHSRGNYSSVCVCYHAVSPFVYGPETRYHRLVYDEFLDLDSRISGLVLGIWRYMLTTESLDTQSPKDTPVALDNTRNNRLEPVEQPAAVLHYM